MNYLEDFKAKFPNIAIKVEDVLCVKDFYGKHAGNECYYSECIDCWYLKMEE